MRRALAAALVLAGFAGGASGASTRAASTLQLSSTLAFVEQSNTATTCPAGTPDTVACFPTTGSGTVPGLGSVTESYDVVREDYETPCNHVHFSAVLTVAGKGDIELDAANPSCVRAQDSYVTLAFRITGGTGIYAGAMGSGTLAKSYSSSGVVTSKGRDVWTGTIDVPTLAFDVTPPAIAGAANKSVIARTSTGVRVRYVLRATDAVDGPVAVGCMPASGSRFRIGRTAVTCAATDSSGNTATVHFTVTVKRPGH